MNEALVYRSLAWSKKPVNAAVRFAINGPRWMPRPLRMLPLWCLGRVVEAQVLWLTR